MASPITTSTSSKTRVITGWKRVAWPVLRRQPLEMSVTSLPPPTKKMSQAILQRANTIAGKHGLLKGLDGITHFQMRGQIPTVVVVSPWSSEKTPIWEAALKEMVKSLTELTRASSISDGAIHFEIIAPELTKTIYYTCVNDPHLSATWDSVRPKVRKCLESFQATKRNWNTIALHRYGVLPDLEANPDTIYISVDDDSDETDWNEVIADIKKMLQGEEGWGHVNVHMEHNENWAGPLFD
ncbi:hypothetical protein FVEG_00135 [Fusarium verticillioides 7600]|uniref:Uncharacterized protein n=1 Tax=Gibberella moniliformis (strain M3125 / FGSC 7600) TaxID=334819 RepID=W7LBH7_GIBM7|nr:hypothetical protein FVEG_00135 [Fusarium verticillioides 7600]EWG35956.1 hypothetical protein FVEG_00135 [Fusarium verticillioides 7600]